MFRSIAIATLASSLTVSLVGCGPTNADVDAGEPDAGQLDAGELAPDAGEPEPDAGEPEPDAGDPDPDAGDPDSDAGEPEPDAGELEPDAGEPDPDAGDPEPDAGDPEPDAGEPEPDAGEPEPDAGLEDAGEPADDCTDADEDGYPIGGSCQEEPLDCDDEESTIFPGAVETYYDGVDSDCDARNDYDQDADGFVLIGHEAMAGGTAELTGDCADTDATVSPAVAETHYDGIDSNCDGKNDYDRDQDGYVVIGYEAMAGGTAEQTGDCDDDQSSVRPDAAEVLGDDIDQNCDGVSE